MKGLEAYYKLSWENACKRCQYFNNHLTQCFNEGDCIWLDIEKELKELAKYKKVEQELIGVDEELKAFKELKSWVVNNAKGLSTSMANEFDIIECALQDYGYLQKSFHIWVDKCKELDELLKHERELNNSLITKELKALKLISKYVGKEQVLFFMQLANASKEEKDLVRRLLEDD